MKKQESYLLSTTPPKQTVGIARRITPFHRFRRKLHCEKIRQKSTGKELDRETGLYYFGARYLDPRTSRWLSVDPAIWQGDFLPSAPNSEQARRRNANLPGIGGVFNTINLHVFHYSLNNPIRFIDPNGREADLPPLSDIPPSSLGVDLNLYNPRARGSILSERIRRPAEGFFVVLGHGGSLSMSDERSGEEKIVFPSDLANMIREHPNHNAGDTIVLISCNTGRSFEGI